MKGRTSVANRSARCSQRLYVSLLVLLTLATICWSQQPQGALRRRTAAAPRLKTIQLPEPSTAGTVSIEQALLEQQRASLPSDQRLEASALGQLAWAAQGVRVPRGTSAAATTTLNQLPAMRLYFILPDGVYSYNPSDHSLQQISADDERQTLATALVNRAGVPIGGAQIVLAGSSRDFAIQYGVQARTVMLLQAGQAAQSLQLEAIGLGLTFVTIDNVNPNSVRRVVRLSKGLDPLYIMFVGYPGGRAFTTTTAPPTATQPGNKKVLLIVPQQAFQDLELTETKRALELAGVPVQVASMRLTGLTGMMGSTANADMLLTQAKPSDYGAIVFIGGPGVAEYFSNPTVMNLVRQAADQRKVVAAIGTAPTILATAGILKGARVTGYLPEQARIVAGGATYTGNPVEKDGPIVTATGAQAVPLFVQAIIEGLSEAR